MSQMVQCSLSTELGLEHPASGRSTQNGHRRAEEGLNFEGPRLAVSYSLNLLPEAANAGPSESGLELGMRHLED